jgi:SAM-dependent methyltransferase
MRRERMNLSRRAQSKELPEWMDEPCSYEDFRACLIDLAKVNRITLAHRPTIHWLNQLVATTGRNQPLHIVDVGCGGGDMLRAIATWAARRGIRVSLTGIDLNPYAAHAARELSSTGQNIQWITGDAYSYEPPEGIDVILSSLFTHHLSDAEIERYLVWMEATARSGWFINDLHRVRIYIYIFKALAKALRWHSFVQHDGPVSIRRSFQPADWQTLCEAAGIYSDAVQISKPIPGRLCVGRMKA